MREGLPAGNRLADFLDAVTGQSSLVAGATGDLGTRRLNHPTPNTEIFGRLFQTLVGLMPGMAYGTYVGVGVGAGVPATRTVANLAFRPDIVLVLNETVGNPGAALHIRGMPADSQMTMLALAAYVAGATTGVIMNDAGFTVGLANVVANTDTEVLHWLAIGFGGAAT